MIDYAHDVKFWNKRPECEGFLVYRCNDFFNAAVSISNIYSCPSVLSFSFPHGSSVKAVNPAMFSHVLLPL